MTDDQEQPQEQGEEQEQPEEQGETKSDAQAKAQSAEKDREEAKEEMKQLEEDPPTKLEDWPSGKAKYETFGGPEGQHSYEDGPEAKLGPSSLRHLEGGEVTIAGEEVENSDDYKGDPIPGGPTDPDAQGAEGSSHS